MYVYVLSYIGYTAHFHVARDPGCYSEVDDIIVRGAER